MKYIISAIILAAVSCLEASGGGPMRVAFVGDPQVDNAVEMGYARRSIYKELAGRGDIDLCLFLGDLVNDDMALLPESVRIIDSLPFPCLMVPGNHDRDVYRGQKARPRDLATWRRTLGYIDTAFFMGNVRFILMNNVRRAASGMTDYTGGFTEKQKHWLDSVFHALPEQGREGTRKQDVAKTGSSTQRPALTILATHIPVSQMKGRDSLTAMIPDPSRTLFVSGHTHYVSRSYVSIDSTGGEFADSIPELVAGAACGSWWRGVKDSDGIPYALQSCGAPRCYFTADISRNGTYRLTYKRIGRPAPEQLSVWATYDKPAAQAADSTRFRLYVNVYGGASDGEVTVSVPKKFSRPSGNIFCRKSSAPAPKVEEVVRFNASMSRDYRKAHRDEFIPLRLKPSTHLWESPPLTGPVPAYVNVRYHDRFMKIESRIETSRHRHGR